MGPPSWRRLYCGSGTQGHPVRSVGTVTEGIERPFTGGVSSGKLQIFTVATGTALSILRARTRVGHFHAFFSQMVPRLPPQRSSLSSPPMAASPNGICPPRNLVTPMVTTVIYSTLRRSFRLTQTRMTRSIPTALLALYIAIGPILAPAADRPTDHRRKLIEMVKPYFPQIARTMRLSGTVKMEVTVGRNGVPKLVDVKGGHPALIKAAMDAVYNWRWDVGPRDSVEPVEVTFADLK